MIVLTNRLHPDATGETRTLFRRIAGIVGAAAAGSRKVLTGIDVLEAQEFSQPARTAGRAHHQYRGPGRCRTADHRCHARRAGLRPARTVQPRAWPDRGSEQPGDLGDRCPDRLAGLQPLWRHLAAHRGDACRSGYPGRRSAGCGGPLLYLFHDHGLCHGSGIGERPGDLCPRPAGPHKRRGRSRPGPRSVPDILHRLYADAGAPRHDHGRAGPDVQRGGAAERQAACRRHALLWPAGMVRSDRSALDRPLAEPAAPGRRRPLSGRGLAGRARRSASAAAPRRPSSSSARLGSTAGPWPPIWRSARYLA